MDWVLWKQAETIAFGDATPDEITDAQNCCMCGGYVDQHGYGDGHSPVDQYSYYVNAEYERLKDRHDRYRELINTLPKW